MTAQKVVLRVHGNAYNIFILVLTVYSLALMALLVLPVDPDTRQLATIYDNAICVVFLIDFAYNLTGARPKRAYLVGQNGWIDLLGSIPSFTAFPALALLRLFRIFRLFRIARLLQGNDKKQLVEDVVKNRGQYATFITVLLAGLVLSVASIMVLQFESRSNDANIVNGGDALWWAIVTITTVGYGDFFPVTPLGRITGIFVMFSGVGIIGALASILASMLVSPASSDGSADADAGTASPAAQATDIPSGPPATSTGQPSVSAATATGDVAGELAGLRAEVAALRASLAPGRDPDLG